MKDINGKKYDCNLGNLWSSLLSLELILRLCIVRKTSQESSLPKLESLRQGDILKKNELINGNYLSDVIDIFHNVFKKERLYLDKYKITRLKNALAHGKIISPQPFPQRIYNFKNIDKDNVKIEFA